MSSSQSDIKKLAQLALRTRGYYSGPIDGKWGKGSKAAFDRYAQFLKERGFEIGDEDGITEDAFASPITGVVVIDPGHGGTAPVGGSSPNNATSASGVSEKAMTLELAKLVQSEFEAMAAGDPGSNIEVHLTRKTDRNLGLSDRAGFAATHGADVFLSIHFNGFNGTARGTETLILSSANGNVNEAEDRALAERIQREVFNAIKAHDGGARDRGVKNNQRLGVLKDVSLGNSQGNHKTRACLLEVEFIDVPAVDKLLNGADSAQVKREIATAIASAIAEDLRARA